MVKSPHILGSANISFGLSLMESLLHYRQLLDEVKNTSGIVQNQRLQVGENAS